VASATTASDCLAQVLSWREYHKPAARESRCDLCAPGHLHFPAWLAVVIVLAIVVAVIARNVT
jgi:hypothetical protein